MRLILSFALLLSSLTTMATADDHECALNFKAKNIDGETVDLEDYEGNVVLVVNVASKCGYTKQYTPLQELHERYAEQGLAIVGVPCNQFGGQEPGTSDEIATKLSARSTFPSRNARM